MFLRRFARSKTLLPLVFVQGGFIAKCDGEDPLLCENPVCSSTFKAFKAATSRNNGSSSTIATIKKESNLPIQCPLDKDELGNATWSVLHTIAAYYPDNPTTEQQESAKTLITSLSILYPCPYCAADFRENISASPPKVDSKEAFSLWLCEQHNIVNEKLNKIPFPCNLSALNRRWRERDPACLADESRAAIVEEEEEENSNS